jgi:nuclear pore complex protein Nup93
MSELTRSRIQLEYDQMSRNTADPIDPYKFAVYKIMGRCELNKRTLPHITSSTEDWLWLQVQYLLFKSLFHAIRLIDIFC